MLHTPPHLWGRLTLEQTDRGIAYLQAIARGRAEAAAAQSVAGLLGT